MVTNAHNLSIEDVDAEESRVPGHPQLNVKLQPAWATRDPDPK